MFRRQLKINNPHSYRQKNPGTNLNFDFPLQGNYA